MKKLLALVLALVMTLSLATVGANAAFEDEKISEDYAEAVAVLNGMGVFQGDDNGKFNPTKSITRAEVATILYRIATADTAKHGSNKAGLYASYNKFSDGNHWAAGYIGYCANAELVKGYPDGTYKPEGNVTGYEVLAMILRAVGYDKNGEFSGADWALNVAKVAQQLGMLENVDKTTDLGAAATRELVAELLFQGIQAKIVTYTPAFGYVTDKVMDKTQTSLGAKFELECDDDTQDIWGRPTITWTYNCGDKETVIAVEADAAYHVATSQCDICADLGEKKSATVVDTYTNGVLSTKDATLTATATKAMVGEQGQQVEFYSVDGGYRMVVVDTYLAKVVDVVIEKADAKGHVIRDDYMELSVYMTNADPETIFVPGNDYEEGDYVLVNVNEVEKVSIIGVSGKQEYVDILGEAESFVGTQTAHYLNSAKHEIDKTDYNDAVNFILDEAKNDTGKYTWFLDQYGNLIGSLMITDPSSYGVIKSIQWINERGNDGYATAVIVDMDGKEAEMTIASIDGCETAYKANGATFDRANKTAYISTNLTENYFWYAGIDLYEIKETKNGAELTAVDELESSADVTKGDPTIDDLVVDNDTQFLFRADAAKGYTFEAVTGYENIESYVDCIVDYVDLDNDGIVEYVYVIGEKASTYAVDFVYITSASNVKVQLAEVGGDDYYVVSGVIRGDASTDALYINANAISRSDLIEWLEASVGKLFKVQSKNGYVGDMSGEYSEIVEVVNVERTPDYVAGYAGKVTVIGNGTIVTTEGAFNTNKATVYVNEDGVMSASKLTVGDFVYVVASYDKGEYTLGVVFVTDNDVVGTTLAAAKAAAVAALEEYAAATVGSSWMQNNYPGITVTVADIQSTLDDLKADVNAAADLAEVGTAMDGYQSILDQAAVAVAADKKAIADEEADAAALAALNAKMDAAAAAVQNNPWNHTSDGINGTAADITNLVVTGAPTLFESGLATVKAQVVGSYTPNNTNGAVATATVQVTLTSAANSSITRTVTVDVTVTTVC